MGPRCLLIVITLFSNSFVFGQEDAKVDKLVAIIKQSEEVTRRKISDRFPDEQAKLTTLLNVMRDKGALSFDEEKVLYVVQDETGQTLLSHFLTVVYVEIIAVDEKTELSSFWKEIVVLSDLLALERDELLDILFMTDFERFGVLSDAKELTVGSDLKISAGEMQAFKEKPLLKKRIVDYMEGAHTRTRQESRPLYTKPPTPVVIPPVADLRTWVSKDGQFKVDAAYRGFDKGIVKLQKSDYTYIEVQLDKFSSEDRVFVQKAVRDAKKK